MTKRNDHTFAICAYKESPYLEECILSLKNQTVKSNIIMATSTPNEWIQGLAEKYEIPLYINTGEGGIAQDWNFAYRQAKTDYITIAHQDDIYEPNYLKMIFGELKKGKDPIVVFTDYGELHNHFSFRLHIRTFFYRIDRNQIHMAVDAMDQFVKLLCIFF